MASFYLMGACPEITTAPGVFDALYAGWKERKGSKKNWKMTREIEFIGSL